MTTLNVKDKEKVRDPGKSESNKPEGQAGEKRKFEEVFQSTKKEEISNQNKKEKIESPVAGSKPSKRDLSDAHIKLFNEVLQSSVLPDATKIKHLAAETKLSQKEIKKWFLKRVHEESKKRLGSNSGKENKPKQVDMVMRYLGM